MPAAEVGDFARCFARVGSLDGGSVTRDEGRGVKGNEEFEGRLSIYQGSFWLGRFLLCTTGKKTKTKIEKSHKKVWVGSALQ